MMVSLGAKEILSDPGEGLSVLVNGSRSLTHDFKNTLIILDHPSETRQIRKHKSLREESNHI
jgi:hypothetical protein